MEKSNKLFQFEVVSDVPSNAVVVCIRAEAWSPFPDNVPGVCRDCGVAVQMRPECAGRTAVCLGCYEVTATSTDPVKVMVTENAVREASEHATLLRARPGRHGVS